MLIYGGIKKRERKKYIYFRRIKIVINLVCKVLYNVIQMVWFIILNYGCVGLVMEKIVIFLAKVVFCYHIVKSNIKM